MNNKKEVLSTLLILKSWISKEKKFKIVKLIFSSVSVGILEIISLMSILPILNLYTQNKEIVYFNNINSNIMLLIAVFGFSFILGFTAIIKVKTISFSHYLSADIGREIGKKLLNNFLSQNFLIHKSRDSSEVINTFTLHLTQSVKFIIFLLQFIVAGACSICILSFIIYKNPLVIVGTLFSVILIYIYIAKYYKLKNIQAAKAIKDAQDRITTLIQEITFDIEKNIIQYEDNFLLNKFSNYDRTARISTAKNRNYTLLPRYIIEGAGISSFILFSMFYTIIFKPDNLNLIANLSASIFGLQKLLPSINLIYQSWNMMNFCMPSVNAVNKLMIKSIEQDRIEKSFDGIQHFKNQIKLSNIYFGFKNKNLIMKDFSLTINKGDKLLIDGPSGVGKSTLINIITSLIKMEKGKIIVDGLEVGKEMELSHWRRQIAYVKQKPYLKKGRVLDLILGKEINIDQTKYSIKIAKTFAKQSCIDKFIEKLPNNYLYEISEDGNTISGGQIQRISIANALASNPALLILDEATSGVDSKTETKILNNLMEKKELTMIVVSHSSNVKNLFQNKVKLNLVE